MIPLALLAAGQIARLTGVDLFYTDSGGDGVPVVFLHAATGSSESWQLQVPAFSQAGFRVIASDRRGSGRSVATESTGASASHAADLEQLIAKLGIARFHLVGTAAGGGVAIDYALSFPDKVRSLTIANSLGGIEDPDFAELGRRLRPPQFNTLPADFRELSPEYRAANAEGVARWLAIEKAAHREGRAGATSRNRITFTALETIGRPVLLITGEADFYMPPLVIRMFKDRMKSAETYIFPATGHSAYWEQPEMFNRAVIEFIRRH